MAEACCTYLTTTETQPNHKFITEFVIITSSAVHDCRWLRWFLFHPFIVPEVTVLTKHLNFAIINKESLARDVKSGRSSPLVMERGDPR